MQTRLASKVVKATFGVQKKCQVRKNLRSETNFGTEKKIWAVRNVGSEKRFGSEKTVGSKRFLAPKKFSVLEYFGSKLWF